MVSNVWRKLIRKKEEMMTKVGNIYTEVKLSYLELDLGISIVLFW